jgi:hypothetical protein
LSNLKDHVKTSKEVIDDYVGTNKWKLDFYKEPTDKKLNPKKWLDTATLKQHFENKRDKITQDRTLSSLQKNAQLALIFEYLEDLKQC